MKGTKVMPTKKRQTEISVGDVFVTNVGGGMRGALRVLQGPKSPFGSKAWLVATCAYAGKEDPAIDDARLREVLVQNRFFYRNQPAIIWLGGKPPASLKRIGTIAPTQAESTMVCNMLGSWKEKSGNEAYLEWRWEHDRAALIAEQQKKDAEFEKAIMQERARQQKPKGMMGESDFWEIIGMLDWTQKGDAKVLKKALVALASKSKRDICGFQERMAYLLYQLDTRAHAANLMEDMDGEEYVSSDGFLYARCVVVANGREFYEKVLRAPDQMPKDLEFEALLSLAPDAYRMKTDEDFEYTTGCDYESFSNGRAWKRTGTKVAANGVPRRPILNWPSE
jgi:hypothetical protein